ncbi:MAG: NADH-quinone oxidoreductase subunit M, partial [Planctomycetota bacterium]
MNGLLSLLVFLPTIGALACLVAPKRAVRKIAVLTTAATLALSLVLFGTFYGAEPGAAATIFGSRYGTLHHVERIPWITGQRFTIEYFLGIDGLSFPLVVLTTLVSFLACLASWNFEQWKINKGLRAYFILFLLLETGMLGVFVALDFFLFYIFWEVMLLPMYFLIGVWGGPRREYAAIKFFLFTLAGSVLMLVALVAMYFYSDAAVQAAGGAVPSAYRAAEGYTLTHGTFDLIELATNPVIQQHFAAHTTLFLGFRFAPLMFLFLFIGFAIKLPAVPVHTWLPDAHVEAPTPISMILAGILLKMGGYGFLRLCYPIFPAGAERWAFLLACIGVISIVYGALCAMAQTDFKKLVAYSSVSHMGYVLLGIAVMTHAGFQGAMFQMIAHGISSPMCFFLVGVIYDRAHHREINRFGGL